MWLKLSLVLVFRRRRPFLLSPDSSVEAVNGCDGEIGVGELISTGVGTVSA
jgi:hypothetical protein